MTDWDRRPTGRDWLAIGTAIGWVVFALLPLPALYRVSEARVADLVPAAERNGWQLRRFVQREPDPSRMTYAVEALVAASLVAGALLLAADRWVGLPALSELLFAHRTLP